MKKEIFVTGKTLEDALASAISELGVASADEFEYEVLEQAKKGLFGIGASPAKVKVIYTLKGEEIALMFVSGACCLHSYVENVRITETYADGSTEKKSLVYPTSLDDWLTSALTTESEIFYFSDYNHLSVARIRTDSEKQLSLVTVEAIANEVIFGLAGVSIKKC